jgi:polysaccharide biosynthesis protein PslH
MARKPATRKRILFLTPQLPYPPQQGTAIRNFHLIAQTARQHEVHLLSFVDSALAGGTVGPLGDLCASVSTVPAPARGRWERLRTVLASPLPDIAHRLASPDFPEALETKLRELSPDVLQVEGLEMAEFALRSRHARSGSLLVFDAHNAEYVLQKRILETDARHPLRWAGATYSLIQWRKLLRYEALVCRRMQRVVVCSEADARAMMRLAPGVSPIIIPNGVDTQAYRPNVVPAAALEGRPLVFTGKMDFRPNVDAMLWFCSQVLPIIRGQCREAHLYIVGKNPHPRLARLAGTAGVTLTGSVEDVRPYIVAAAVYVAPLLTGGGTRLKILEAMAMGKPIVSTTLGCEGIGVASGREVVLADGPAGFAQQVLRLLQARQQSEELGRLARAFVEQRFDWSTVAAPLGQAYER